jgi:hypothetical protein
MNENQRLEWKESWRDEYLRWICGFANAEGGKLVIGMDDRGVVKGVAQSQRLLDELPNKIRDILGVMAEVRLVKKTGKELVEIKVAAYPSPISHKGEYWVRSGGTNQQLKGAALDRFLLRKHGRTWDGVPVPRVAPKDLSKEAVAGFRGWPNKASAWMRPRCAGPWRVAGKAGPDRSVLPEARGPAAVPSRARPPLRRCLREDRLFPDRRPICGTTTKSTATCSPRRRKPSSF